MRYTYPNDISIVAGGYSFSQCDANRLPGYVIAVNDAAYYLYRYDEVVSMDRRWSEYRMEILLRPDKLVYLRRNAAMKFERPLPRHIRIFECDHTSWAMTDDPTRLNGRHSGACAMNLAYQLRPKHLWLFGFDACMGPDGEEYWYPPYPWSKRKPMKLREWAGQFEIAAQQFSDADIDVTVVGKSRIPFFNHIKPGAVPC